MSQEHRDLLKNCFRELSEKQVQELASAARIRTHVKGEWILSEGLPSSCVHWLESGRVELIKGALSGRSSVLHVMRAGHFIDLCTLFGTNPSFYSAIALEPCLVVQIGSAALLAAIETNAAFSIRLMRELAARQRMFINKISASQGKISVRRRVAGWLLHKARVEHSLVLENSVTREVLAGILGLSRESLCRQLGQLSRDGIISLERKSIAILDEPALRRILEE
ncbi:MAG: Crp/Fnr family transcriptional regulator [Mailhella sp.]|nr:Crp/Fnr family transcriptional regulator [Mailhella sp.]